MFEEKYFRNNPAYAKFATAASAQRDVARFYAGEFRHIGRFARTFVDKDIADVGCGYAGVLRYFRDRGNRCTGFDVSDYIVNTNREISRDMTFERGDITAGLPGRDGAFDVLICMEVLEHLERSDLALANIMRALRPGGHLVMSSPNRNNRFPIYRWEVDATHINVRPFATWHEDLIRAGFEVLFGETVITLPMIWRLGDAFSRTFGVARFGPTCLFVARKPFD
ncbi:MAG: hypothetical protein NVS2B3_18870 [Vulcanimicrobiaceae bacterium]